MFSCPYSALIPLLGAEAKEYREINRSVRRRSRWSSKGQEPPEEQRRSWKNVEEIRRALDQVAKVFRIEKDEQWARISKAQVASVVGGKPRNVYSLITTAYPEKEWAMEKFKRPTKSAQFWLFRKVQDLLPSNTETIEDYHHPRLKIQLDIWIPQFMLAIEYQGEPHYFDTYQPWASTLSLYRRSDPKKLEICKKNGILLVAIPFWWDKTIESLSSTLHLSCPHLFKKTSSPPIHTEVPTFQKNTQGMVHESMFLMHGRDWIPGATGQDPRGWWMSEKLDGVRSYWNGEKMLSRTGKVIETPKSFLDLLSPGIPVDGELWCGRGTDSYGVVKILVDCKNPRDTCSKPEEAREKLWKPIKYMIFDAPKAGGNYEERHEYLRKNIVQNEKIQIIPITRCQGRNHLENAMAELKKKGGEGIMIYEPNSSYIVGRTNNVLKAKIYDAASVEFLERSPGSFTFICRQLDGHVIKPRCSSSDYLNPPQPGTWLTVRYSGFLKKTKKMKYPLVVGVTTATEVARDDLEPLSHFTLKDE
eukprot:TRINITY_DN6318_c0_g1_i1.p1 TRINITY_DN6318_c0_g1~~TRINITY_DN6318_c0_g1_i1.p1  ORF type:complete len:531 (+),score=95.62 TRINITY_DN6318_c0_g1_i1:1653-3245(+)